MDKIKKHLQDSVQAMDATIRELERELDGVESGSMYGRLLDIRDYQILLSRQLEALSDSKPG